ncbi:MAG: regulatory protein RecX [Hespellia sp.]|nr:regulatory protein RecX [Hespellia sp.]
MIVTKLEPVTKTKFKVYLDEEFAFVLYKGEVLKYHMKEEEEVSDELFHKVKTEIVQKRAKLRAMHLLNDMDRTEAALREKLRQNYYTDDIIDGAIEYVKSFGYIDDYRYAVNFVESRKMNKSKKEVTLALKQKGVPRELASLALEECYGKESEQEAISQLLRKKNFHIETASEKEIQKIYGYLARKGFRYDDIRQVVHYSIENT